VTKSTTDPECGLFHKGEHEQQFAYITGVACDKHNFVLGYNIVPGNTNDSTMFSELYKDVTNLFPETVTRHVWKPNMELAEEYRHNPQYKAIYALRKETIERDAKEKHGMRYTQLRGLLKVKMQAALTFACMNLKQLANWKCRTGPFPSGFGSFSLFVIHFLVFIKKNALAHA